MIAGAAIGAFTTYRIWQVGLRDDTRPADAIVVLGAAQYDGTPSPVFAARLRHAVALYTAGVAPLLVVTGGGQVGDRTTEAAVGRAYALRAGVPDSAILVEDASRTTIESLEAVAAMLGAAGSEAVVLVSDRTHMLRALRIAKDLGLDARASPATDSPTEADIVRRAEATLHELAGLAAYFVGLGDAATVDPTTGPSADATVTAPRPTAVAGGPSFEAVADLAAVAAIAQAYETARAAGDWPTAWALLAPYSRLPFGGIDAFAAQAARYNASGGDRFEVADPVRNPDLSSPLFFGKAYLDMQAVADPGDLDALTGFTQRDRPPMGGRLGVYPLAFGKARPILRGTPAVQTPEPPRGAPHSGPAPATRIEEDHSRPGSDVPTRIVERDL